MLRNHHHQQQQQQQTNLDINDQQKIIHTLTPVPVTTEVQEEELQQQPKDSRPSSRIIDSKQQSSSPTTSSVNWIDHIEDYSHVDAMMTTTTTTHHQYHHHNHHHRNVYTSSTHHHHQAQQQQHHQQQQQPHLQPQPPNILKPSKGSINIIQTGGGGGSGSGSAVPASESAILQRENQKLASITRLCIHLVDRCRTLNKSKQFIKDLSRLGIMIEEFNRINTRKNSQLPTFSNGGLVCAKPETQSGAGGSDSISKTVNTSTMSTNNIIGGVGAAAAGGSNNQIGDSTAAASGMYFIPIINHQSFQQIQFIPANETTTTTTAAGMAAAANPMIAFEKGGNIGKCSNKTKKSNLLAPGLMMMNPASMVHHQPTLQQQQQQQSQPNQQQSILFKKLTESGQLIDTTTSMILQQTTNQQQIPIHMNIGGSDENDQHSALFSIIPTTNQSDDNLNRSDLEPDVKLDESDADGRGKTSGGGKIYRCNVCEKLFANSYNLNRHTKSHSGFQPYVCEYPDCYKKFNYNYHLKRHMETHTGARPFVCTWPDCDQRFNRKFNLNRHLWIHTEKESRMMPGRQKPSNESSHLLLSHSTKMTSSSSGMVAGGDGSTGGAT